MINEAFMFFWVVSFFVGISVLSVVALIGLGVMILLILMFNSLDERKQPKKLLKNLGIALAISAAIAVIVPPKAAFYAGATQYVAEAAEVDQTLLRLKEVIDSKIEELEND